MDDTTKEAIDSILSTSKKRSRPVGYDYRAALKRKVEMESAMTGEDEYTPSSRPAPHAKPMGVARSLYESSYEHIRAEAEKLAKPPVSPTHCYTYEERSVDLKQEIATLSVDTASASIVFKGPINTTFVVRINGAIPPTQREWMEDKKAWRFAPAALAVLKPILKDTYKDVQMLGVPKALPSTKFDQLMAKLTKDDKALVYRLLASKYHPDKGGSHEVMTLINIVFRGA